MLLQRKPTSSSIPKRVRVCGRFNGKYHCGQIKKLNQIREAASPQLNRLLDSVLAAKSSNYTGFFFTGITKSALLQQVKTQLD